MGEHDVGERSDVEVRRVRRGTGERARRRREERRARRWRIARAILLGGAGIALVVLLAPVAWRGITPLLSGDDATAPAPSPEPEAAEEEPAPAPADPQPTMLVATFDDNGEDVTRIQLFSHDAETGRGAVVLVPTSMMADVPGYGLLPVGDAGTFGGLPLLELTLENQLGIAIDGAVRATQQDWAALFARTGGFEVEVARALAERGADGTLERRFEPGPQFLDGPRLAELLTIEVAGEDELTSFARVRQVLEGFLVAAGDEGVLDAVFADGAPMLTTNQLDVVEAVLRGLAGPDVAERVVVRTLPVIASGSGATIFYRLDEGRATQLVAEVLGGTEQVSEAATDGLQLEVLNGNGRAGIGADVAALLVPLGHTVAITRNADDFNHTSTRVVLYGDDEELVAAGQEIIDTLGVGRVEFSDVPSSIVDITVLVGADFPG